ncbi:MAG: radical SAM protein, partial [Bacteroidetes bacterium]|nr:radical SAM protein [Bacteroidota bacterium]
MTVQPTHRRLTLLLIKPSKYDDEGFVIRYRKGFLPSNTLACLHALSDEIQRRGTLGSDVQVDVQLLDDTVHHIDIKHIARRARDRGNKTLICLAGVQTNQFPRAADLALQFRSEGLDVLLGGFHVSGSMRMLSSTPPEIQSLLNAGVTIVLGEVEDSLETIFRDGLNGTLQPIYNCLDDPPDLRNRPLPKIDKRYLRHFVTSNYGTIDCGRGCPFHCSFCTIINVQGRRMRCRDAETLKEGLRANYLNNSVSFYFFTDDNFARNRNWEEIFDAMISLREEEHIPLEFMTQVDVLSYRIPNFIRKARRAGCSQVFIGVESLNPDNLSAAEKTQNKVEDLQNLVTAYHAEGVMTHASYIIGFPFDTRSSVRRDMKRLTGDLRFKQASFFMLTP